jgi:hypothetical protein
MTPTEVFSKFQPQYIRENSSPSEGARQGLLQGKGNLLVGKTGPLHREFPPGQIFSS